MGNDSVCSSREPFASGMPKAHVVLSCALPLCVNTLAHSKSWQEERTKLIIQCHSGREFKKKSKYELLSLIRSGYRIPRYEFLLRLVAVSKKTRLPLREYADSRPDIWTSDMRVCTATSNNKWITISNRKHKGNHSRNKCLKGLWEVIFPAHLERKRQSYRHPPSKLRINTVTACQTLLGKRWGGDL